MPRDGRTDYAQASDIRSRSWLEYRRDMKRKAIVELEIVEWLQKIIQYQYPNERVSVEKAGSDKFLWFLRAGGISRDPDYRASIGSRTVELEFQYASQPDLRQYDFKVSKVAKKNRRTGRREPIQGKQFIYIHMILKKYALIDPEWIFKHGNLGPVPAWGSREAYRVPSKLFEAILHEDRDLPDVISKIYAKLNLLEFQFQQFELFSNSLGNEIKKALEDHESLTISTHDLHSLFLSCFMLSYLKIHLDDPASFLKLLTKHLRLEMSMKEVGLFAYCLDYLYFGIEPPANTNTPGMLPDVIRVIGQAIKHLTKVVNFSYRPEGFYLSSQGANKLDETRYAVFALSLFEDIIQDAIHYYNQRTFGSFGPIKKIFDSIPNITLVSDFLQDYARGD